MDLSIIIVNWKSAHYLKRCLTSIQQNAPACNYEIVVIDSASFDGCEEMMREHFPRVRFIQSNLNLGFARANNVAFSASVGRYVLFLNPDTEVLGPAITTMKDRLATLPNAGSIGCKLLNSDYSIQTSCIQSLPTILNQFLDSEFLRAWWPNSALWGVEPLFTQSQEPVQVEAISGACVMLKREVFNDVGLFSDDYFMYAEDIDLSYKTRQAGYRNYYVPNATVIHHGGSSSQHAPSNFSIVMMREAIWRFLRKFRGKRYGQMYKFAMLVSALGRLLLLRLAAPLRTTILRHQSAEAASRKWRAVLRWSLEQETWVRQYYPS